MKYLIVMLLLGTSEIVAGQTIAEKGTSIKKVQNKEIVIMYKGNVWHRQNGTSILVGDKTSIVGIKVKADGTIIFPNDSIAALKEGDFIENNGKIYRVSE